MRALGDSGPDDAVVRAVVLHLVHAAAVAVMRVQFWLDAVGALGVVLELRRADVAPDPGQVVDRPCRVVARHTLDERVRCHMPILPLEPGRAHPLEEG